MYVHVINLLASSLHRRAIQAKGKAVNEAVKQDESGTERERTHIVHCFSALGGTLWEHDKDDFNRVNLQTKGILKNICIPVRPRANADVAIVATANTW